MSKNLPPRSRAGDFNTYAFFRMFYFSQSERYE